MFQLCAKINGLYSHLIRFGSTEEIKPLIFSWLGTLAGLLVLGYVFKSTHELSRVTLGLYALLTPTFLIISRVLSQYSLSLLHRKNYWTRAAVILGDNENTASLANNLRSNHWLGLKLLKTYRLPGENSLPETEGETEGSLDSIESLIELINDGLVDIVFLAVGSPASTDSVLGRLTDTTVSIFIVPDVYTADIMQGRWMTIGSIPTVSIVDTTGRGINGILKRALDFAISGISLLLLALPMVVIAAWIRVNSPGPALYRQLRYGESGKPIYVRKFRTMTVVEKSDEFKQAVRNDPRVTSVGRWLRRSSVDELPQLINVLLGDMSIVGPRPHPVALNEEFRGEVLGYMMRHKVKPGITGLAQINGYRGETDTHEKMSGRIRYDLEYIHNWSIWLDLVIIAKTPFSLIRNKNVY